jgi:hypothetical protein
MVRLPQAHVVTFKARLAAIKRIRGFIPCRESSAFAHELASLLEGLEAGVSDPRTGAELVAAFYEMDDVIFNHCDDSNGRIGDVFRHDARDLFVHYASRCDDKQWLGDLILRLNRNDGFGLRDSLFDCAADYLPEETMRGLIGSLWALVDREANEYQKGHWLRGIESFARQLRDAPLFEKARRASWPTLCTAACVDIAAVYLESGDAATALSWLERIPESESFQADERDRLLLAIHEQLGNRRKQEEAAWRIFRRYRCEDTLGTLLRVIGDDQRERVIDEEASSILECEEISYSDAAFLISSGRTEEAEAYLLARAEQLDGYFYDCLLPLAESMERDRRFRMASVIYRALLESILSRAQSKYYHHGVRYLKKLDALAGKVDTWLTVQPHRAYMEELRQAHRRKSSFWSRYNA